MSLTGCAAPPSGAKWNCVDQRWLEVCLGIPGQIIEYVDREHGIAKAQVSGVRRNVNVQLLQQDGDEPQAEDWVLIHVGFAMSKIDEEEAQETYRFLEGLGQMYDDELKDLVDSDIE
jgi:hydrogenase expression/formation protein HypC